MSYIGNQVTSVPHVVDVFSGDNATTTFGPLTRAPAGTAAIAVFIDGVYRTPGVNYTLNGDTIVFNVAPGFGTNIVIHHLGNGTTTQVPSDGSVTGTKLAINSVRGNNIVAGTITGNQIASGAISGNQISANAVSGNQIASGAVSGNQIGVGAVSGNQIGTGAVSGNQISVGAVSGNQIGLYAVSGNQIGVGAISANNFAGGGITSNVLASNLTISLARAVETANIVPSAVGEITYNIHVGNSAVYFFSANTTGNITFNLRANTQNIFDSITSIGQSVSVAMIMKHGSTRHSAALQIDGTPQTLYYAGQTAISYTQTLTQQEFNVIGFNVLKTASNTYTVLAANTLYKAI